MARVSNLPGMKGMIIPDKPRPVPPLPPEVVPVFDPEALAVQSYSAEGGLCFIQGKSLFTQAGNFLRALPESQWYVTTPEMEANNRKARAKQRAMFMGKGIAAKGGSSVPDTLLEAAKENARAFRAEALAE